MRRPVLGVLLAAVAGALVSVPGPALADPSDRGLGHRSSTAAERAEIRTYWTAERMAAAVPADSRLEGRHLPAAGPAVPTAQAKPVRPSGGTAVAGATWTGGGLVSRTTGKVFFTERGVNYVCSGSVVDGSNDSTVLTAGHCVHEGKADGTGQYASNWTFVPAYNGKAAQVAPYGRWPFVRLQATPGWLQRGDFAADVAFATVDDGDPSTTLETVVGGAQRIAFGQAPKLRVHAFGYPQAAPYDGTTLTFCSGDTAADPYGRTTQGLVCNMTGGSSGGPWYSSFDPSTGVGVAYSLNSYRYTSGPYSNRMFGPRFGTEVADLFAAVSTAPVTAVSNAA